MGVNYRGFDIHLTLAYVEMHTQFHTFMVKPLWPSKESSCEASGNLQVLKDNLSQ
jgi:hypothetical protein